MRLACLCLTYNHPIAVLENAIACFENQTYRDAELLVLDDSGLLPAQHGDRWRIATVEERFPSLPDKYDAAVGLLSEDWDALIVWEDDDVYLSWHLETYASALTDRGWAHPSEVYSLFDSGLRVEPAIVPFFDGAGHW